MKVDEYDQDHYADPSDSTKEFSLVVYSLVMTDIAIENGRLEWIYPSKTVIFHSYAKLPAGF